MKNEEYTVELTMNAQHALTEACLLAIAEMGGAAGGNVGERRFTTTMTVKAAHPSLAIDVAIRQVLDKVDGVVVAASALTVDEFDRREAAKSALVGVAEVAVLLGISRQRVTTLSKREDFPAPVQRLAAGPIWREGDLSTFKSGWQRKGGRPAKERMHTASGEVDLPRKDAGRVNRPAGKRAANA